MKRAFDILLSSALLFVLWPVLLFLAIAVRVFLGSPVLFRQRRPGLHGAPFELIKFRSMTDDRDATGGLLADERRLTRFGAFLRSTSLDELPELVNVLKGEMSIVGPRPLMMAYLDRYTPVQARRHEVRPGLTGWVQINGRNALSWPEKFALDVWYVDHRSLWLDIKIICITAWRVLGRAGITAKGSATMPEFMGGPDGGESMR